MKYDVDTASSFSSGLSLYISEISKYPVMTDEELSQLYQQMETEPENKSTIINTVVLSNLRLVVHFAKKHLGRGLEIEDLIQIGNIGLMKAAQKYDRTRGTKFSTNAAFWINHEIERSISWFARPVRLPENILLDILQINKTRTQLQKETGHVPTINELASHLSMSVDKIARLDMLNCTSVSLDAPLAEDPSFTIGETIPSNENIIEKLIADQKIENIRQIISTLNEKEQKVIHERYSESRTTLEDLGKELKLTRERVRQIESTALLKITKKVKLNEQLSD